MDNLSPAQRKRTMSAVRSSDTKPEIVVRRLLYRMGYRFRLHRKDLPGVPDIVLPKFKTVILVHGCFWHQHSECKHARRPTSRREYWDPKLDKNVERDVRNRLALESLGWKVLVIWECKTRDLEKLKANLSNELLVK